MRLKVSSLPVISREIIKPEVLYPILEEFPQVPIKTPGKSRTAFVLFKTHQIAKEVKGKVKGAIPIKFKTIKDTKTLRNQLVLSLIDVLLIILESFLIIGLNIPLEGSRSTNIGKIHIIEFPWSTLEKISAIILRRNLLVTL